MESSTEQFRPVFRRNDVKRIKKLPPQIDDSFHQSLSPVATFVQFLSLMPVCGISHPDPSALKFKLLSVRVIFTVIYISYGVFISSFFFTHIAAQGISAKNIGNFKMWSWKCTLILIHVPVGFVFFSYTTTCTIVFFFIATQWPVSCCLVALIVDNSHFFRRWWKFGRQRKKSFCIFPTNPTDSDFRSKLDSQRELSSCWRSPNTHFFFGTPLTTNIWQSQIVTGHWHRL